MRSHRAPPSGLAMTAGGDVLRRLRLGSAVAGACVVVVGFVALVGGWWLDIPALRQPLTEYSAMRSGTAFALILSGTGVLAAGLRWPRWVMSVSGVLVGALGAAVITGYVLDLPKMGFEAVFALHPSLDESIPGRIAINTGACFVMVGVGLILLALQRADGFRQALGVGVFLIPYTAIMGYAMSSGTVSGQFLPEYTAMAPTTAGPMLLIGVGLLLVSVERSWGRIFAEPHAGGSVVRLYLPITLALFLTAAFGFGFLQRQTGAGPQVGAIVLTIVAIAVVVGLMVLANRMERADVELASLSAEAELRAQLEQAQRIAHVGRWSWDLATNHTAWSEELFLMHGLDPTGAAPTVTESQRLYTPESWRELSAALAATAETGAPYEMELEMVRPDGSHGWMLGRGEAVRDATGAIVGLQGVAMDITDAKAANDALQALATHDPLTGLANRAALLDEITRASSAGLRSGRATALLILDLDRFKNVNDTLGHAVGDALLVAAARRLESVVRAGDLVARLGGDEFVVVMRDLADPTEAVRAAWRLVEVFRASFTLGETELYATASIGVATSTESRPASDLVREADSALYAAKDAGRDRVSVFNEDLRAAAALRLSVEVDLRHALERVEFAVWYQPEVDLTTGRVVAVEALLRWHHPDGSVWTADQFIGVAEDTGLILDIGDWVLYQACAQAATWVASRPNRPLTVRVNASALQLAEAGLLPAIDDALATSGVDPSVLCIEMTETALLRQTATASTNLNGIRERRIAIAIDDFGTGYASLTYLRRYPVDTLKIDRSFIIGITSDDHDRQITAGIIALARALGITATAEGVEHPDQAALLREIGCPSAQGWLYSKALPAEEVTALLNHTYPTNGGRAVRRG